MEAARQLDDSDPQYTELLLDALDWQQRTLFELGRRREGLAVREEMAGIGRRAFEAGTETHWWKGPELWARALAPALPLFDEGVALARRLGDAAWTARVLLDRARLLIAGKRYADAYTDCLRARVTPRAGKRDCTRRLVSPSLSA
ncbi:hypothetical protein [Streptomyces albiflavescens]|uniref:hypothetical protein n=1 Tax=Streptomyces albiflavescens TaxID=1623582 RepID=UPI00166F507C|nr:hypothetical protein [Streptomyces albiflavescens]